MEGRKVQSHSMSLKTFHPMVYCINTRTLLKEFSHLFFRNPTIYHRCPCGTSEKDMITLEDIPSRYLDWIAQMGFQFVYLLGVWSTGKEGYTAAEMFMKNNFPDVPKEEICSSPFAITSYTIHPDFGGIDAFKTFRRRLTRRNLGLILDFVPNHIALDHEWVTHPTPATFEYILPGTDNLLKSQPQNFFKTSQGRIVAHGKDPNFDGWNDTVQLNYFCSNLRKAMILILEDIAELCDGVRCDMASLVISDVFQTTWSQIYKQTIESYSKTRGSVTSEESIDDTDLNFPEFWPLVISRILMKNPEFFFIAEVYGNHVKSLMTFGFHYCYDKMLYDSLKSLSADCVRDCVLLRTVSFHNRTCRFIENHDEKRAATVFPDLKIYQAALILTYTLPGMKLFHMGQLEGRTIQIPMQRCQFGKEDSTLFSQEQRCSITDVYYRLLDVLNRMPVMRSGYFQMLYPEPSEPFSDNYTHQHIISYMFYQRKHRPIISRCTPTPTRIKTRQIESTGSSPHNINIVHHSPTHLIDPSTSKCCTSDESSSVPQSSTISDTDYDEGDCNLTAVDDPPVSLIGIPSSNSAVAGTSIRSSLSSSTRQGNLSSFSLNPKDLDRNQLETCQRCSPGSWRPQGNKSNSTISCTHRVAYLSNSIPRSPIEDETLFDIQNDDKEKDIMDSEPEDFLSLGTLSPQLQMKYDKLLSEKRSHNILLNYGLLQEQDIIPGVPNVSRNDTYQILCNRLNPILIIVNYSSNHSNGFVKIPVHSLHGFISRFGRLYSTIPSKLNSSQPSTPVHTSTIDPTQNFILRDIFQTGTVYCRNLLESITKGIWFNLLPWEIHIFEVILLDNM